MSWWNFVDGKTRFMFARLTTNSLDELPRINSSNYKTYNYNNRSSTSGNHFFPLFRRGKHQCLTSVNFLYVNVLLAHEASGLTKCALMSRIMISIWATGLRCPSWCLLWGWWRSDWCYNTVGLWVELCRSSGVSKTARTFWDEMFFSRGSIFATQTCHLPIRLTGR